MASALTGAEPELTLRRDGHDFHVVDAEGTRSWSFWQFWEGGQWEPTTIAAARELLRPGDFLIDVGAWVGPLTLWAAKVLRCRVVAVEPDPTAAEVLRRNVALNGAEELVTVVEAAVSVRKGYMTLYRANGGDAYSSVVASEAVAEPIQVRSTTLEELIFTLGRPTVVKIDIEGGEAYVLPKEGPLLRRMGVPLLLALHPHVLVHAELFDRELEEWALSDLHNNMYLCIPRR